MISQNVLITGGDGALGSSCDFGTRLSKNDLDITDLSAVMRVCKEQKPKVIVHCAARTNLLFCEEHPEQAYFVNATGTYHIALTARSVGAKLIYISTSDVFEGTKKEPYVPEDIPNPTTVYGHSKYFGELAVQNLLDDYVIMRISWMFGGGKERDNKFVGKLLRQGAVGDIRATTDKRASPSWSRDVAKAIQTLIHDDKRGIYHVGGGVATKFDIAQEIISITGWDTKVTPVKSSEFPSPYTIGDNESMPPSPLVRPWKDALREYIETEWLSRF